MDVYRITRSKYAKDLSGEGARLHGGRWNHPLTSCLYTSESRALAILEFAVNIDLDAIPRALCLVCYSFDINAMHVVDAVSLPGNWREFPAPISTRSFGTRLLDTLQKPIIKIPSCIIPEEFNYLIHPAYIQQINLSFKSISDFAFDTRIKASPTTY